jgi:acetoin utilization deacetylase AcuC-like enzyme
MTNPLAPERNMQVFYSDAHRKHDPPFEVLDGGVRGPYLEDPGRATDILAALQQASWAAITQPVLDPLEAILAIHSHDYVDFLASAWRDWVVASPENAGASKSVLLPATFALRRQPHVPASILGRAGYYMMDLSACIVEGTYAAAVASAACALSAARSIADRPGAVLTSFALCRPPGHHAGRDYAAGYCFINNAAVAGHWLSSLGSVAVLDVDYHAGNGTQDIFYDRRDVLTISLHADPASEYPYYAGYADETGSGPGAGFHRNFPLPAGTDDARYLAALDEALALVRVFGPRHLVISCGMDIYEHDSLGQFKVSRDAVAIIGERIAALRLPTAIILEGGYNNADLGANMLAFLYPFALRA